MYNSSLDSGRGNFVSSEHSESGDPDDNMEHKGRPPASSEKPASTALSQKQQTSPTSDEMKDGVDTSRPASNDCTKTSACTSRDPVTEAVERRKQCRDISCYDVDEEIIGEGTYG